MGDETGTNNENAFIAALDVGTTNVKCLIVDSNGTIVGNAYSKVCRIYILNHSQYLLYICR